MTTTLPSSLFSFPSPTLAYSYLAGKLGADPSLPRPFLIGIRGIEVNKDATHPLIHKPAYDDTFVLLVKGEEPTIFPGATHAYQANSTLSQDLNHDGVGDVASIMPGKYILTDALSAPYPIFILTMPDGNGNIPAWRDTNHDGKLSTEELEKNKTTANAVLLHTGIDAPPDSAHRSSIACQTTSLRYLQLIHNKCQQMKTKVVDYVLINVEDVLSTFDTMPEEFKNPAPINNA